MHGTVPVAPQGSRSRPCRRPRLYDHPIRRRSATARSISLSVQYRVATGSYLFRAAARWARGAKVPARTAPPLARACVLCIRAAAAGVIGRGGDEGESEGEDFFIGVSWRPGQSRRKDLPESRPTQLPGERPKFFRAPLQAFSVAVRPVCKSPIYRQTRVQKGNN